MRNRLFSKMASAWMVFLALAGTLQAQTEPAAKRGIEHFSLWEMIWSVGWVLIPLLILSIIVIALIIFNLCWLQERRVASSLFLSEARKNLKERNLEELISSCHRHRGSCAKALVKAVEFARENPDTSLENLKEVAEAEGARAVAAISRPNLLLMDCGAMAPMIGLLGTVVGILRSFGNIAGDTTPMRTVVLAGGVSQALMATAIGLTIGLLAMFFYAYFRGRVQTLSTYFDTLLVELLVKTNNCLARKRQP